MLEKHQKRLAAGGLAVRAWDKGSERAQKRAVSGWRMLRGASRGLTESLEVARLRCKVAPRGLSATGTAV